MSQHRLKTLALTAMAAVLAAGLSWADGPQTRKGHEHLRFSLSTGRASFLAGEPFDLYIRVWNPTPDYVEVAGGHALLENHGILRIEVSRDGVRYAPIGMWIPCTDFQTNNADPECHGGTMRLPPYELVHQWHSSYYSIVRDRVRPGFKAFAQPGTVHIRLAFRGQAVTEPVTVHLKQAATPDLHARLMKFMDECSAAVTHTQDQPGDRILYHLHPLNELIPLLDDAEARKTMEFIRDHLTSISHPDQSLQEAALARIEALADDKQFHLRRRVLRYLTGRYGSPDTHRNNPANAERARRFLKIYLEEWPLSMVPGAGTNK